MNAVRSTLNALGWLQLGVMESPAAIVDDLDSENFLVVILLCTLHCEIAHAFVCLGFCELQKEILYSVPPSGRVVGHPSS